MILYKHVSDGMEYKIGTIILQSDPYALVLANKYRKDRCNYCLKRNDNLRKCTACSLLRYCDRRCQKTDWLHHRRECKCLQKVAPSTPTDSVLLMLRLVLRYMADDHTKKFDGDPGWKTYNMLMSHVEDIKNDTKRMDAFTKIYFTLSLMAGEELQLPSTEELLGIFGRMVINTFTVTDDELQDIGSGIYLSASVLDHSCEPNAIVSFQGRSLCVRATEEICMNTLENVASHVFLCYIDQLAPTSERQDQLKQQYYFTCTCMRCTDPYIDHLLLSGACKEECEGGVTPNDKEVSSAIKTCQEMHMKISEMKKCTGNPFDILMMCRDCLMTVKGKLSAYNVYLLRVLDCAFDAAISCQLWDEALTYGIATILPYRKLYSAYNPNLGLQLMRVGKLQLLLEHTNSAVENLKQAEKVVSVTQSKDSELYKQVNDLLCQACSLKM